MNRSEVKKNLKENNLLRVGEVVIECENDLYCVSVNGHALHTDDFDLAYQRFVSSMTAQDMAKQSDATDS